MKEEWRTVVINGKENPWYSVSNFGNVRSHLQRKGCGGKGGFYTFYNPNYNKDIIQRINKRRSYSSQEVKIQCPENFFEDYQYCKNRNSDSNVTKVCSVHSLVMAAFRPMDDYPPDRLKDCWNNLPEVAKTWIKETVIIHHINHNPTDNHVDNLVYVTPRENTRAAVKYYGGNHSNKGKVINWLKITDPVFNPLLQEWEDGEIQFYGSEGEKNYKMLEDIARQKGKSVEEIFFGSLEMFYNKVKEEEGKIK